MDLPQVESYRDYRVFLHEYFATKKRSDPRFSHRAFAARAGFTSSALVPLLIQGKRNLTVRYLDGFVRALGFDAREAAYFRVMVDFTHAKTDDEKGRLERLLARSRSKRPRHLEIAFHKFHESWVHVALYQALACLDVRDDLSVVQDFLCPSPPVEELRRGLVILRDLGMVRKDRRGFWKPTETNLHADLSIGPWVIRGFRDQMIELGRTAHERFPVERRRGMTETLSVGPAAAARIRERLDAFRREVVEITVTDREASTEILQLNMQLFPLTREKQP
jgi:uncharacterized protein (TIGR02147 family)